MLAGILSAACTSALLVSIFRLPPDLPLIVVAAIHILLVVGAHALGVQAAGGIFRLDVDGLAWRSGSTAALIAPLSVYLQAGSIYAIPMAAVTAVYIVMLFRASNSPWEDKSEWKPAVGSDLFQFPPPPSIVRLLPFAGAALCIQASLAAGAAGAVSVGTAFVSVGTVIIAWHVCRLRTSEFQPRSTRQLISTSLTLIVALSLTNGALRQGSGGSDGEEGDREQIRVAGGGGGTYWGVYLWPEVVPKAQPLSRPLRSEVSPFGKSIKIPLRIRFDGVYWFFRPPDLSPPPEAIIAFGSPYKTRFLSTDATPIMMEAHQRLLEPIDPNCCSRIEVSIRNADSLPNTVVVELLLIESPLSRTIVSLGRVPVSSTLPFQRAADRLGHQTLKFSVPEHPSISSFDEMTIRFHMGSSRETMSPKIAIEDLTLIPR